MSKQKLIIVSNRLPVSVKKVDGKLEFKSSSGGLATGLKSIKEPKNKLWIGWPGIASDDLSQQEKKEITEKLEADGCVPVFLTEEQISRFYDGYSNETIWPVFHYFTSYAEYSDKYWDSFIEVNQEFEVVVKKHADKNTDIWVHDYQLMLLPQMLREKLPNSTIGFFLHIPFPSYEVFRAIPQRTKLIDGILGADLIGFHTYDYVRHFLSTALRLKNLDSKLGNLFVDGRIVKTDSFPISIDYKAFAKSGSKKAVKKEIKALNKFYQDQQIILSVDRLDYSKGILSRLEAFDQFLEDFPEYHHKVKLVMVAVPSRTEVEKYKDLRDEVEQTVSRINGRYGRVDWTPISYQFRSIPFEQLAALYNFAEVALVTPLRDGMNLVAKEYVAAKKDGDGVLILSEMTGVSSELPEATIINPNNTKKVARAIKESLEMPYKERRARMENMRERISQYDIMYWVNDFMKQLGEVKNMQQDMHNHRLNSQNKKQLIAKFKAAKKPLLLLDYDGTLIEFADTPDFGSAKPSREVKKIIKNLSGREKSKVVIISGRPRKALQSWFRSKTVNLVAEHGGWVKDTAKWAKQVVPLKSWKKQIQEIMEGYVDRTPGSVIEKKDYAIVWHYRRVPKALAYVRRNELIRDLKMAVENTKLGVYKGNMIVEVKPKQFDKGTVANKFIEKGKHDFILCIGDDYTDEHMFEALENSEHSNFITIKVGEGETKAMYHVPTVQDVTNLLKELSEIK